jgi:hypothetical protein
MEIFPTLKTSLATLVRKVRSGLTAGRDETQPEMIAVVRLSVRRGIRTRIDVHMQLYMALFTLFAISFAGLIWVAALAIVLLMQFTGVPIVQWEALLRHAPQELLPSLFAVDPETWVRIRLFFELEGALFVTFFILALIQARSALREFRWHREFSRLPSSELPPVPISRLMQISKPLSLHLDVFEEPSPTQVLDLVQKNHSLQLSEVIANYTLESIQRDEEVTTRAILDLSHEMRIKLKQSDGKQAIVTFRERGRHSGWARLLSYLAERPRGEWIDRDTLLKRCDEVAIEYGRGYLADHYDKGYNVKHLGGIGIWEWARDPYIKYRNRWLFILESSARRLRERAEQTDVTADERAELMRQVAKCLGRSALATIVVISEVERSVRTLRQCLALYRELLDYKAAEDLLQEYVDQLELKPDFWRLPPEAEEILRETTGLLEQFYEHRKRQKARRRSGTKRQAPGSPDLAEDTPRSDPDTRPG